MPRNGGFRPRPDRQARSKPHLWRCSEFTLLLSSRRDVKNKGLKQAEIKEPPLLWHVGPEWQIPHKTGSFLQDFTGFSQGLNPVVSESKPC